MLLNSLSTLASARVESEFKSISHLIFGSQVNLLVQIAGTANGVSRLDAGLIFKQAQLAYPSVHEGQELDKWLAYLIANHLILMSEWKIDITQYGKDFLKYLVDKRLAYNRHG